MAKDYSRIKSRPLTRNLAASLAGLRAGGAMALDQALQKIGGDTDDKPHSNFARREAAKFVTELGKLKGSYVKIGQMLALFGEHFLPPVLTEALHNLEDSTEPLPWSAMQASVQQALGERYTELDIEPQAIAAASMAQVHRATIRASGAQIVLKIQYPGLADVIDSDFDAVVRMLMLARWLKAGRDLDNWLAAMREQLHTEMDYHHEAEMATLLQANLDSLVATDAPQTRACEDIVYTMPRFHAAYCSRTVLAMDYIEGDNVSSAAVAALPAARRNPLAKAMLELFFLEVFEWGLLQTDPNFGNYLIRCAATAPGATATNSDHIVMLDFGALQQLELAQLDGLRTVIAAGLGRDTTGMIAGLQALGWLADDAPLEAQQSFADFCMHLLEPLQHPDTLPAQYLNAAGEYHWGNSRLLQRAGKAVASKAASRHFATPSKDFVMLARKLTGVFTFIAVLDAEFNGHAIAQHYVDRWEKRRRARQP